MNGKKATAAITDDRWPDVDANRGGAVREPVKPRPAWDPARWPSHQLSPVEYIEARTLTWLKELDRLGDLALRDGDLDLAARIRLALLKFSSVNRQRIDVAQQTALAPPTDLSELSEIELKALELCTDEQLEELARRIGDLRSAKPADAKVVGGRLKSAKPDPDDLN
jgi:hypothetical protein